MPSTPIPQHLVAKNVSKRNVSNCQGLPKATTKRLKHAGNALDNAIRLANLIPKTATLPDSLVNEEFESRVENGLPAFPTIEELETEIAKLPSGLAAHLSESLHDPIWSNLGSSAQVRRINNLYDRIRSDGDAIRRVIQLSQAQEIGYLRECKNCGNIFFAGRIDKWGCSASCLNKLRKEKFKKHQIERELKEAIEEQNSKKRAKTARER